LQYGDLRGYLKKELMDMEIGRNKDIVKFALHGFWRDVYTLLLMYAENRHEYYVGHMVKIREAIRQHRQPRVMISQKRGLHANWTDLSYAFKKALQYQKIS